MVNHFRTVGSESNLKPIRLLNALEVSAEQILTCFSLNYFILKDIRFPEGVFIAGERVHAAMAFPILDGKGLLIGAYIVDLYILQYQCHFYLLLRL